MHSFLPSNLENNGPENDHENDLIIVTDDGNLFNTGKKEMTMYLTNK